MKTIVCYGDSNTYGCNPVDCSRHPRDVRWTGRLQSLLGEEYTVIEEGCNGRTTIYKEPIDGWKSGLEYLKPCLNSHKPVDMVVMMLGTNDLKTMFHATVKEIAAGAERLVQEIYDFADQKQEFRPQIVLVSPPEIGPDINNSAFRVSFDETAIVRSKEFAKYYREVAKRNGCIFFDAAKVVKASKEDSLHLMAEEHAKLAEALAVCIKENF